VDAFLVFLGAVGVLALTPIVTRHRRKAERRALMAVPETPIAAVRDGEKVRIRGRAVARDELKVSSMSQRRCIGYHLTVDFRDPLGGRWQQVVEDHGFQSFLLEDDTGKAVVHPPFELRVIPFRETIVEAASPALASLLTRKGLLASEVFVRDRMFQYVETLVMPGDELIAVGRARIEIDAAGRAPSHRDPPVMCHLRGADEPVVIAAADEP
jgi:hypothetical protein